MKSEREALQEELVKFLTDHPQFNAPFGIIPSLDKVKHGFVRSVTFGIARNLDCLVRIWSKNKITVLASGPSSRNLANEYTSMEELQEALKGLVS